MIRKKYGVSSWEDQKQKYFPSISQEGLIRKVPQEKRMTTRKSPWENKRKW